MNTDKLIAELTERYLNPPYSLPFIKAREYAMREALKKGQAHARRELMRETANKVQRLVV